MRRRNAHRPPWPGVERLYWYEFPAWWRRQLAAARCRPLPRLGATRQRQFDCRQSAVRDRESADRESSGVVVADAPTRNRRRARRCLARRRLRHGLATAGPIDVVVRGAVAGIWDGGQLDDREADDLAAFCRATGARRGAGRRAARFSAPRSLSIARCNSALRRCSASRGSTPIWSRRSKSTQSRREDCGTSMPRA